MRSFGWSFAAAVAAGLLVACGGTASKPHGTTTGTVDAGHVIGVTGSGTAGSCSHDTECGSGQFCIDGRCGSCRGNPPLACPSGESCGQSGACVGESTGTTGTGGSGSNGGSTGVTGTTGTSGTTGPACDHRSDCTGAEACLGLPDAGDCGTPDADAGCNTSDACVKGYICQAHACVFGCLNNLDCHGTPEPVCVPGNPGHCGPCSADNQCQTGEICSNGACVTGTACSSGATCPSGQGCVSGVCAACTDSSQCATGDVCDTASGVCGTPTGCTDDASCQSQHGGSTAWWCATPTDGGLNVCALGCVADSLCATPQAGCCNISGGQTCNTSSHRCESSQTTASTTASTTTGTTATTVSTTTGTSASTTTGTTASTTTGTTATTSTTASATSTTGTSSTTSTTTSSSTTATSTTGTTSSSSSSSSTTGTSGTTGTVTGAICSTCSTDSDCTSGFCNTYESEVPFCDSAQSCHGHSSQCGGVGCSSFDNTVCACTSAGIGYCAECETDADCPSGGFCIGDDSNFDTGASCSVPCAANNTCPSPNDTCYEITDSSDDVLGTGCFPTSKACF